MNRPDAFTMHRNARRDRSRLMALLARRLVRRIRLATSAWRAAKRRPVSARYPMPQQ
ncbi:MAG: hypothetical protein U1F54_08660 [Burkholderiales bacterium]